MLLSVFGLWLLITGYFLVAFFISVERMLRRTGSAKTFQRGKFDGGSTLLIGSAFGVGLFLPLIMDLLGIEVFSINLTEGFLALAIMIIGIGLRIWAANILQALSNT